MQAVLQPTDSRRFRAAMRPVVLFAALAGAAWLGRWGDAAREYQPAFIQSDRAMAQANESPFAAILGELRASAADLLWIKTERYLHRGVAYASHMSADEMAHHGKFSKNAAAVHEDNAHEHEHDDAHEHEHAEAEDHDHGHEQGVGHEEPPTLIPSARHDFRGFVGTLQRAVAPWQEEDSFHNSMSGEELLPWYRLLTLSNPHHWRGYMIGAWWLSKEKNAGAGPLVEAERFIDEGIRNNPNTFQLQLMRGRIKLQRQDWAEALASFRAAGKVALLVRPRDGKPAPPTWTESDEEDFGFALRYIPFLQWRKLNDPAAARASVAEALRYLPDDQPLKHFQAELNRG